MKLGSVLFSWRKDYNLTLDQASKEVGVKFRTLSELENGGKCSATTLVAIINWLTSEEKAK